MFDKTGTITHGEPEVQNIIRLDEGDSTAPSLRFLVALIASAESASEHPLAQAVVKYGKKVRWQHFVSKRKMLFSAVALVYDILQLM